MSREKICEIDLKLNNKEELFGKPEITPFSQNYQIHSYSSGIEFIAAELYAKPSYQGLHATIILPQSKLVSGLEQEIKLAVKRYCQGRLKAIERDMQATRWRGTRALIAALFILFVLMGASIIVHDETSVILQIISIGLAIGGWVAMWWPLERLMFTAWGYRLDKKIYALLLDMDVTITQGN